MSKLPIKPGSLGENIDSSFISDENSIKQESTLKEDRKSASLNFDHYLDTEEEGIEEFSEGNNQTLQSTETFSRSKNMEADEYAGMPALEGPEVTGMVGESSASHNESTGNPQMADQRLYDTSDGQTNSGSVYKQTAHTGPPPPPSAMLFNSLLSSCTRPPAPIAMANQAIPPRMRFSPGASMQTPGAMVTTRNSILGPPPRPLGYGRGQGQFLDPGGGRPPGSGYMKLGSGTEHVFSSEIAPRKSQTVAVGGGVNPVQGREVTRPLHARSDAANSPGLTAGVGMIFQTQTPRYKRPSETSVQGKVTHPYQLPGPRDNPVNENKKLQSDSFRPQHIVHVGRMPEHGRLGFAQPRTPNPTLTAMPVTQATGKNKSATNLPLPPSASLYKSLVEGGPQFVPTRQSSSSAPKNIRLGQTELDVLAYLKREGRPCNTLQLAKSAGKNTKKEINPVLYRMQTAGLIFKMHDHPPTWKLRAMGSLPNSESPSERPSLTNPTCLAETQQGPTMDSASTTEGSSGEFVNPSLSGKATWSMIWVLI